MDPRACHPSTLALQRQQQTGDLCAREPPPYPGHLKLWQQSGYSTSYSGSEASTDMSMSSLESLSTSARQEPQGEETADMTSGLMDDGRDGGDMATAGSTSLSSLCNDIDFKSVPSGDGEMYYELTPSMETWPTTTSSTVQNTVTSTVPTSGNSSPKFTQSSISSDGRRQKAAVSAYAANSLIRQLLQTSPQYSHILSDIALMQHASTAGSVNQSKSSVTSSPKSARGEVRSDGRNLPATPIAVTSSSSTEPAHGSSSPASIHSHVMTRRLVNGYVNIDNDNGGSTEASSQPTSVGRGTLSLRDRPRPSTAPTEREREAPPAAMQQTFEHSDRHRSFELLDRDNVTPSKSTGILVNNNNKEHAGNDVSLVASRYNHQHLKYQQQQQQQQQQQPQRTSPLQQQQQQQQHSQRTSPTQDQQQQQQQQQQQVTSAAVSQFQRQRSSPQQQLRSTPPLQQQRCSPQQSEQNATTAVTSSCLLQARNINSPSHSPSGSQQNSTNICAHAAIATRATQMVERLSEENRALRQELKVYYKKVSKLEKVERDIQKVNDAYETLARHSQKRENLEKLMRLKLEAEIGQLTDTNQQIQDNLEQMILQIQRRQVYTTPDSELKKELLRKDALIAKFISQNRELTAAKLRLESDISKQCSVVQETRARIKMLENVLAKEVLDKRRFDRQQSTSSEHQGASDDCDGQEQSAAGKLEDEFQPFKYQTCDTDDGISSDSESPTNIHGLIRQMQEKERHILRLEAEVARWEQKFLEETVFRQLAVDAISIPKDAKIAALVQNSADTDKMLAEARLEKLTYLKQLHNANERCAHLEAKVKSLQADLAERDGLVRVLQHHSSLSRASSISSLLAASCGSPLNSPQQQHRSPTSTVIHPIGSKPASGASSRQGSQLSAGSLSLTKTNKLGGNVMSAQDVHHMSALDAALSYGSHEEPDQLKQCFWQV